jgi:Na+-driven multidrug efflux pump
MAAPLVVSFMMRAAFTFLDTAFAATIGDEAVAAIGLTAPFEFLMVAVWIGLSTGLTSCLSRAMGARAGRNIELYVRKTWVLVGWMTPAFALAGVGIWLAAPRLGLDPEVARTFQIYGTTFVAGSAATAFWSVIPDSIVKAHHDTRSTMWAGIWSNVIKISLNVLFLFGFGWGVFGIAFSTVLGRVGGLTYALIQAGRHERRRIEAGRDTNSDLDPAPYRSLLSLAVPSSLTFALMSGETAIVNGLLATLPRATEAIAAYSIYYRVTLFCLNPVIAGGVAMLPYAARRFGEGDLAGVRRGLREAGLVALAYSIALVGPGMLWGAAPLARWLAESPLTAEYTAAILRFVPLACVTGAPFLLARPVFEAMGRGRPGLAMAVLRYVVLALPACWLGMRAASAAGFAPIQGLVVGLLVAGAATSAAFLLWLGSTLAAAQAAAPPQGLAPAAVTAASASPELRPDRR